MRWRTLMLLRRGHGLYISLDKVNMCHRVILWSSAKACHGFGQTCTVFFFSNHSSAWYMIHDTWYYMLMLMPQAETPGVTHFGAYHRPPDVHCFVFVVVENFNNTLAFVFELVWPNWTMFMFFYTLHKKLCFKLKLPVSLFCLHIFVLLNVNTCIYGNER